MFYDNRSMQHVDFLKYLLVYCMGKYKCCANTMHTTVFSSCKQSNAIKLYTCMILVLWMKDWPTSWQTPIFSEHICRVILTLSFLSTRPVSGVINSNVIDTDPMQEPWPYIVYACIRVSEKHEAARFPANFQCNYFW